MGKLLCPLRAHFICLTLSKIPTADIVWSILTMILAASKDYRSVVALRFFIGLAESPFFAGMHYVLGSWYKEDELGKRACIFQVRNLSPMMG
jgi:MFS transporter, ACS family, pantothenate transporter